MQKRILCIDDTQDILDCFEFILTDEGHAILTALSPEFIYDLIADFKPDLILLDINLCEFNGLEVCKDLKQNLDTKNIPVLMVSSDSKVHQFKDYGAVDFVLKPFHTDHFIEKVNQYLSA
ncbi:MAG: response regulator [Burkholderiales bacterium]|nr:response regulator [Bacteroidia bacterium]